jgi:hypothetical protein
MTRRVVAAVVGLVVGAGDAALAHDPYSEWQQPSGASCCSGRDCRPMQACMAEGGKIGTVVNGGCVPLPENKRVPAPREVWETSPEPLHVCAGPVFMDGRIVELHVFCWDYAAGS